jgi:uncharacterized protein (DUF2141 family)
MAKLFVLFISLFSLSFEVPNTIPSEENLTVEIQGFTTKTENTIRISVFSKEGFLKKPIQTKSIKSKGSKVIVNFTLPKGEYAISSYLDVNNNGELDRRFYGAPKEPIGFSNNIRPKFGPPSFSDCSFPISNSPKNISITLK